MEKSIESIWKEGFLKSDALVAPRINDLYNRKSKNIVNRIKQMMSYNIIVIVLLSFVMLIWWYITDAVYTGVFIFLLFNSFALGLKLKMNRIKDIDTGLSTYQYLRSFHSWLKTTLLNNAGIMRFFYPLIFLAGIATIWFSGNNENKLQAAFLKHYPAASTIVGIPVIIVIAVVAVVLLITFFGGKIYKWDMKLVYGRVFKKLEEIIADIEQLKD